MKELGRQSNNYMQTENSLLIFEQGESLARELGDERSLIRFRSNISYFYCSTGNYLKAVNYIEQAFEATERIGDIESIGQVIVDLWVVYLPTAEHAKIIDVIPRVIDALEKAQKQAEFFGGLSNVYATLFSYYAYNQAFLGNFKEAVKFCEMGLQVSANIDSAITLGICHSYTGDDTRTEEFFKKGIEISRQKNESFLEGALLIWLGRVLGKKHPPKNPEAIDNIFVGGIGNFFSLIFHFFL